MHILTGVKQLLALIFPPRADEERVAATTCEEFLSFSDQEIAHGVITLLPYSNECVRAALWEAKFHRNENAVALLAHVLAEHLTHTSAPWALVPIPLAPKRRAARGYNQCELVAHNAVRLAGYGEVLIALRKIRDTPTQTSLSRNERLKNVDSAFEVAHSESLRGKKIFILDDVTTTGATLKEARRAFGAAGFFDVTCIALTRAGH